MEGGLDRLSPSLGPHATQTLRTTVADPEKYCFRNEISLFTRASTRGV